MRIGVLGGAFDPPHAAHAALAHAARHQLHLDRVIWVPTFAPPHKNGPVASFGHRLAMTRLLAGNDSEVSDIESSLPLPSYTLQTLTALKARHVFRTPRPSPDHPSSNEAAWYLILGADNAAAFARWHQPEAILAEASLAVYPRSGAETLAPQTLPAGTVMLNFPEMSDQSTAFRQALGSAGGREGALTRLPPRVASYIREHGLYEGRPL